MEFKSNVRIILQIERRLENVRLVSHNAHKRMVMCLQGNVGSDVEKRHVSNSCFYIYKSLRSTHFWNDFFIALRKSFLSQPFHNPCWTEEVSSAMSLSSGELINSLTLWQTCILQNHPMICSIWPVISTHYERNLNAHSFLNQTERRVLELFLWSH